MEIFHSLQDAIESVSQGIEVQNRSTVSGGDINNAYCYRFADGRRVFVKTNRLKDSSFFLSEAKGLDAISSTKAISTPRVLAAGDDTNEGGFLIMEYEVAGDKKPDFWENFGICLSKMHQTDTDIFVKDGRYGFSENNYIGSRAQDNTPHNSWVDFFRDCRLAPRFEEAMPYFGTETRKGILYLLDHLDKWIMEPEQPSLLHGDLWGGNFIVGSDGRAWLIDPAVYVGDADADIAMTELFGGFDRRFYQAYRGLLPERPGYEERRDIYNLYHLLNHLISFSNGYLGAVESIVRRYAR